MKDILQIGERIANIRQAFNIREGLNARKFVIPDRILGRPPKEVGPNPGVTLNEEDMYNEFLAAMDWDIQTCKPSKKKLQELGLEDVARELY
jgi:aldehyde:ferredoxin oxidoreductase